jgi:hypothetical protein
MAVSRSLRFQILRRDNHACRYCGATAPDAKLTVDHVVPQALGGADDPTNLVTACATCNGGKAATPPDASIVADVARDALRWARAMEAALDSYRARREEREAYANYFDALWSVWTYGRDKEPIPREDDWRAGLGKFFDHGLNADDLVYAVRTAMEQKKVLPERTYRYFCGICWTMIKDAREVAADIVMADIDDEINEGWTA